MINDIVFILIVIPFIAFIWGAIFFAFDHEVLNGYFKKKLQQRFSVEDIK